jgi:hypothetical protein
MGVSGQRYAPAALSLGIIVQEAWWTQGRSRWVRRVSFLPEFDPLTVQPVVSCYTD